ncbi:MAG: hypothetical protein RBS72_16490, partial [Sedimentisphaerales bacterium]|nr:hypothetical protein [Sedimentisphaerales bacterium]HNY79266.1 hypothetical protein [Sedimentisphaerales bacterium]HOC61554.1 hypothetical protein [Sedimentisphaerales bacterium]HOH65182.1 hypothetical protein [Sedimentisphaerales bacterium]HQA90811.1 hypothetical protein [Sedimentisphaerales bacterium]
MSGNDTQAKGIGPAPILFVAVGCRAEQTVAAFAETARGLTVPVQGPFAFLSMDPAGRRVAAGHWTWLSDFDIPACSQTNGLSEESLSATVASLIRTLHSKEPAADANLPGRVRMSSYILIDLSEAGSVDRALPAMELLRTGDPAHDMAIVALTGRTAASGRELDDLWFEAWTRLTARLQDDLLAQKIYLLDGRDAGGMWFERPEQMDQFAAQFLLHHGVTCRGPLRQNERRRITPQESVLNVCGSFGLRAIHLNLPEVIRRTAQRLVHEDLAGLYQEVLAEERRRHIDEEAQKLVERIESIYEAVSQARPSDADEPDAAAYELVVRNKDACEAIGAAVGRICGRAPLASLSHLLKCAEPRLRCLLTRQKLVERQQVRSRAAEVLRRQDEQTYQPMRVWLGKTEDAWVDRFTPIGQTRTQASVSRPAGTTAWRFGLLFLVMGFVGLAAELLSEERVFALGGALLCLAAAVLATQPTGWTTHSRTVVPEGCDVGKAAPVVSYRKRAPLWMRSLAIALAACGAVAVAWSLWPDLWTVATALQSGVAALLAVIGVSVILTGPVQVRADQPKCEEAPDHLCPPFWTWRAFGLLCLASAWLVLCLRAPSPLGTDASLRWGCHGAGLVAIGVAAALALRPRVGRVRLIERIPKVPEPLAGGISIPTRENDLIREVTAMVQWIDRLTLDPRQALLRQGMSDATPGREVLFDLLAADWDRQLAEAFRQTLRSRIGQSLRDLALEPKAWAQCVVRHLQDPQARSSDLGVLFTLEVVKVWVDSLSVADLAACVRPDAERLSHLLDRAAMPNWPAPRVAPEVGISVAAVGSALWGALSPLTRTAGPAAVVRRDWDAQTNDVLILHIVQGLTEGWRGYPALPGQRREPPRLDTADSTLSPSEQSSSAAPQST